MKDLICIGDIKLDTFIAVPDASVSCQLKTPTCELCIAYGKKIPVDEVSNQVAGSAPNVAIGVARLGGRAGVWTTMGRNGLYHEASKLFRKEGVSKRYVFAKRGQQNSFSAVLNFQGESTQLAAHVPVNYELPYFFPHATWFHLSELGTSYAPLFEYLLAHKQNPGFLLSFNPGAVQIKENTEVFHRILGITDLLFVNKLEARILTQKPEAEIPELLTALSKIAPGIIVITDGKAGAYATDRKMNYHAPMFPGERVEATGAGDAFSTGVLGGIIRGFSLPDALAWGSVNSASVVQYIGPTRGLLTEEQIKKALQEHATYRATPM